ncbi:hypothetical protein [Paenibacillus daejeonensis]|uniref:hypothetical protein n=1 Tax=Paenibacillus daejeonensis TaxID=135193 RepID=UPI00037F24B3|nr:hypothetical protein [Paenibacillus daejeonensis]
MISHHTTIARNWTDDYLDLLNYASQIGDQAWYNELLAKLQDRESHVKEEVHLATREQLWRSFDEINRKMLALYKQVHTSHEDLKQRLLEQILELKSERVKIGLALRKG